MEKNDSFLNKFRGRTEVIGRGGIIDIMNNVHINVNDYQVKQKKQKSKNGRKKSPKNEYNYITSEISKEFNKNKNYIPQLRSLSMSVKPNKNNENIKNNNKNNSINNNNNVKADNNKKNNSPGVKQKNFDIQKKEKNKNIEDKKNIKGEQNNKSNEYLTKSREKPIKLFKYFNQNENIKNDLKQSKDKNNDKKKEEIKNNIKNRQSPDRSLKNKNKINIQLPSINPNYASPKEQLKKNILKNLKVKQNKSYDRVNTFTPKIKNNINIQNNESEKNYQSLKVMLGNKIKNNKKEKNNVFHSNSLSLPKINVNKKIRSPSNKNLKEYSSQRNINIQDDYNNVLNNIRKDFLLLDSIKKGTNQYDNNDNLTDRHSQNKKINYQINNQNINNNSNNIKRINKNNDNFIHKNDGQNNNHYYLNSNSNNNNIYSMNNINYYNNNNNNNLYNNNNVYNIKKFNNINNTNDNNYSNDFNNMENMNYRYNIDNKKLNAKIQYNNNDGLFFGSQEKKKAHTSFDIPPILPGFKKKLDIINEEDEDDNKYITDFQINNNIGNNRNLNTLEILMNQRRFYQNKMPNNSRFKLKQIIEQQNF